ncbi:MAG: asparaginase domain-containing protein [Polyangiaceae bacterium]
MRKREDSFGIAVLTTGGTIDKTYDETDGSLRNVRSVLEEILSNLRLVDLSISHVTVMSKDSLDMTEADREQILAAVEAAQVQHDAVVVIHGTDTLSLTGERLVSALQPPRIPVILTGAFRPYEFRDTDALQNVTESLLAARLLEPGVYVVMHGRALAFPGVTKHRGRGTFCR